MPPILCSEPMQRFFSTILTISMLVHTALGCCVHHTHVCETGCMQTKGEDAGLACGCRHGHDEPGGPAVTASSGSCNRERGNSDHSHHQRRTCAGGKCNFARTESSPHADSRDGKSFLSMQALPAILVAQISSGSGRAISPKSERPVEVTRRHLLLAVLLL